VSAVESQCNGERPSRLRPVKYVLPGANQNALLANLPHDVDGLLEILLGVDFGHDADLVAEHGTRSVETVQTSDLGSAVVAKLVRMPRRYFCFLTGSGYGPSIPAFSATTRLAETCWSMAPEGLRAYRPGRFLVQTVYSVALPAE